MTSAKASYISFMTDCGSCNNIGGGPDFSLVTLPPGLLTFDQMGGFGIWMVGLAMVMDPFIKPLMRLLESRTGLVKTSASRVGVGVETEAVTSYVCGLYTTVAYISYHRVLLKQPYSHNLQNNQTLAIGYLLFLVGLGLKATCIFYRRWTTLAAAKDGDSPKDPSHKHGGDSVVACGGKEAVSFFMALAGYSLIMARMCAVVVCSLLVLSYVIRCLFQRLSCRLPLSDFECKINVWLKNLSKAGDNDEDAKKDL